MDKLSELKSRFIVVITSSIVVSQAGTDEVRTDYSVLTFCIPRLELKPLKYRFS